MLSFKKNKKKKKTFLNTKNDELIDKIIIKSERIILLIINIKLKLYLL